MSRLDKFQLITGIVGLVADTIAIGSFASSLGLIGLPQSSPDPSSNGGLLLTAIIGFYSLALIIWFLIRLERSRQHNIGDIAQSLLGVHEEQVEVLVFALIPLVGAWSMTMLRPSRTIFLLAVFIAFFPTTLWIYALSAQAWLALGIGLLGSALLSQYSAFFAIVLDNFFH